MEIPFWTIITTLAYNILSNLLTPPIQKFLGSVSESLKKKSEERQRIFDNSVQYLLNNPQELIYLRVRSLEHTIMAFMALFFGLLFTVSDNGFIIFLGISFSILGNYGVTRNRNMDKLLREIQKQRKVNHPNINLD